MATVIHNDGDKVVGTIAERDAIANKFEGMKVLVRDATADVNLGGGSAEYVWSTQDGITFNWEISSASKKVSMTFVTETLPIDATGQVTASNIPLDGQIWNVAVVDAVSGVIIGDFDGATVDTYTISLGVQDYNGQNLRFSYAYGSFSAQLDAILYNLKSKSVALADGNIDLAIGALFTRTITANSSFTVSNVEAAGVVDSFIVEITDGGSWTVDWFAGVEWEGGAAPVLTATGTDIIGFYTYDGGVTWRGTTVGLDVKPIV